MFQIPNRELWMGIEEGSPEEKDLDPDVLAYEKTFNAKNRNTALLNVLADEIVSLAERQGLDVVGIAPTTVKKRVTGNGRASKREVAQAVVAIYPELRAYLPNGSGSGFRSNLFDAVAVGIALDAHPA